MRCIFDPACPGIKAALILMHRQKCNALIIKKSGLGSIAVMGVIVKDRDAFQALCQRVPRCNCHIVEDTKSHGAVWFCMVTWRPNDGKRVFCFLIYYCAGTDQDSTRSQQSILE